MHVSLVIFGGLFMALMGVMVLVPYLRRRADLITTWNLFLLGSAVFVGASAINAGLFQEPYVNYTTSDYGWFYAGVATFYLTIFLVYRYMSLPAKLAGRSLRKWPTPSVSVLVLVLPVCVALSLLSLRPPHVPVLGQLVLQMGPAAALIGLVLAFVAWYTDRVNPILLWILLGMSLYALVFALAGGSGRRPLVAVLSVPPVCLYWLVLRYKSRWLTMSLLAVALIGALFVISGYSAIRHRDAGSGEGHSVSRAIESVKMLPSHVTDFRLDQFLGQNAVNVSLTAIHLYTRSWEPQPFHSAYFVLVNPIPRNLWPDKPEGLGLTLPRDIGQWRYGRVNWGAGIVGHGFHEGGLHMLVFYGLIFGCFLRYFDELLARQPGNPFLLGILCAISGQVIGWPRGGIGVFSMQIINGIVTGLLLAAFARAFFGTGVVYPRTDDVSLRGVVYAA